MEPVGPPVPVRRDDAAVTHGLLAVVEGSLLSGAMSARTTARIADLLVDAGLLDWDGNGAPPAGRVAVALEDISLRLRYALGDHTDEPEPRTDLRTTHVLRFPTQEAADGCRAETLERGLEQALIEVDDSGGWALYLTCPGLPPDPEFLELERVLQRIAAHWGGRYAGSQAPDS